MNVDATQTGIVFQYHQVQMIVGISCLVVVFQDVLNQGRYRFHLGLTFWDNGRKLEHMHYDYYMQHRSISHPDSEIQEERKK